MGNHKMKGFVVAVYVVIFSSLKFSLAEQIEGDVVAGLISIDQPKAGDYAAADGENQGQFYQIRGSPKNPDFRPTSCVAKGPDGTKYKIRSGHTFKDGKISCLCDVVVDLPPHQCGIAFKCIDASMEGNWTLIETDSTGAVFSFNKNVKSEMHACIIPDGESNENNGADYEDTSEEPCCTGCTGCPEATEVNQEIVDFAVGKLQETNTNVCTRDVKTENFKSQLVAGTKYTFDMVCPNDDGAVVRCHVEVVERVWEKFRKVTKQECIF